MISELYSLLIAPFADYDFMRRALAGSVALSFAAAPVGVFLMLRRMSLSGDAMAHAILPGAAVGYLLSGLSLSAMTIGGMVAGLLVALLSGALARLTVLKEDTTLAAFYLISLAAGVLLVSLKGSNVDLLHVLFGSVLALDNDALILLTTIATLTLVVFAVIFRPLVLECLDPSFLRSVAGHTGGITHLIFLTLVVLNLVGAFHALGTLLAVGLMMLPAASARLWSKDVSGLIALAALFAVLSAIFGLLLSYHASVPTGPAIILLAGLFYLFSLLFGRVGGLLGRFLPHHHLKG